MKETERTPRKKRKNTEKNLLQKAISRPYFMCSKKLFSDYIQKFVSEDFVMGILFQNFIPDFNVFWKSVTKKVKWYFENLRKCVKKLRGCRK
ncbi:hypothetical protein VIGAN_08063600 [Vigna angularis var. angularis]|uniref:Uncharacterized protein n=1 Tax=Vigna angularis var. angularis TaxID=157739 RepID=A0A0S3SMJ1_PHAAN|nr:hypothetical protein VIGAN_08063600 [Vigna angularis var. angularis]